MKLFDKKDKQTIIEELNKVQRDWLDYLKDNDNDEESRQRLFVVSFLKNLITTDRINLTELECDEDDSLFTVDVD